MPLLEVTQIRHASASIRLADTTASLVDQYAHFIHANADDGVEQALAYVFSKDRASEPSLKPPEAKRVPGPWRTRKARIAEPAESQPRGAATPRQSAPQ